MSYELTREQVSKACLGLHNDCRSYGGQHTVEILLAHDQALRDRLAQVERERDHWREAGRDIGAVDAHAMVLNWRDLQAQLATPCQRLADAEREAHDQKAKQEALQTSLATTLSQMDELKKQFATMELLWKAAQVEIEKWGSKYRDLEAQFERAQARIEQMERERDALRVNASNDYCQIQDLGKQLATAQAQSEQLRAALKDVVDLCEAYGYQQGAFAPAPLWCYPHIHKCSVDRWRQILADEPSAEAIKQSSIQHEPRKAS